MLKRIFVILLMVVMLTPMQAQDGLNLPAEMYILLNDGVVERYGFGAEGVSSVTPDGVFVLDFAIAPGGNWLAYRTEEGLYLDYLPDAKTAPILLEGVTADIPPIRGHGDTIAWSHDGHILAYTTSYGARVAFNIDSAAPLLVTIASSPILHLSWSPNDAYLATEIENDIWLIYRRGAAGEMPLTGALPSSYGTAWLNHSTMVFAPMEGGVLSIDFANVNTQSTLVDASQQYRLPYVRPDGTLVAFAYVENAEEQEMTNQGLFQAFSIANGRATLIESSEIPVDLTRLDWAPQGQFLIAFRGGVVVLVLPLTGDGFPLPIASAVAYSWGSLYPPVLRDVALDADGYFLAQDVFGRGQVWKLPEAGFAASPLTNVDTTISAFAISPDAQEIAYLSEDVLWIMPTDMTSEEIIQLAEIDPQSTGVEFSPDGQSIVYASPNGIWELGAESELPQQVLLNDSATVYSEPHYAPNIRAFLVKANDSYAFYDPASDTLMSLGNYDSLEWMIDGRLLAISDGDIIIVDPATSPATEIPIVNEAQSRILDVAVTAPFTLRYIHVPDVMGPATIHLAEVPISGGESTAIAEVGYMLNPQISPDGRFVSGSIRVDGRLLMYSVDANQLYMLQTPININDFYWFTLK